MISISNKQETIYFTGDIGEYTVSGQYFVEDDYIVGIDAGVTTADDRYLGFIHLQKVDRFNSQLSISYDCNYDDLSTLQDFLPSLLEEFKLYKPESFNLEGDSNNAAIDTIISSPVETVETVETVADASVDTAEEVTEEA